MKTKLILIIIALLSFTGFAQNIEYETYKSFTDGFFAAKMVDKNIAGAAVSIIKNNEVVVHKGYGFSDISSMKPVNPDETLFRIGSISKLFVWLAVMQQVEKGKLDLDKDINNYLTDFQIPSTFDDPITMRHLMSHTPGFEDRLIKLFTYDTAQLKPLNQLLSSDFPERIRPAGVQASYSNHGTALAAHIVENLSGLSWEDYVTKNIIKPLGMLSTTFKQPLPYDLSLRMSKGYNYSGGLLIEKPFEIIPLAPVGAVSTTANDMGIFMKMLMNKGKLDSITIISDSTFLSMFEPVLVHTPGVNPCIHGFMDLSRKSVKIFGHGGDTFWFHSLLAILPEHNTGIFVTFNSSGGESSYNEFLNEFVKEFIPNNDSLYPKIQANVEHLKKFEGEYKMNRYPHNDYLKIISLLSRISIKSVDGKLLITQGEKKDYWIPTDSNTFRRENDSEFIKFTFDNGGKVQYAYLSTLSVFAFEKIEVFESQGLHFLIFIFAIIIAFVVIFYWPAVFMIRSSYLPMSGALKPIPLIPKITAWSASLLLLVFYVSIAAISSSPESIVFSVPESLRYLLVIPILLIPIDLFMLFNLVMVWPMISTRLRSKVFYTLIFLAHVAALWQLYYWNLLGWHF